MPPLDCNLHELYRRRCHVEFFNSGIFKLYMNTNTHNFKSIYNIIININDIDHDHMHICMITRSSYRLLGKYMYVEHVHTIRERYVR